MPISAADCLSGCELGEPRLAPDGKRLAYIRSGVEGSRIVVRTLVGAVADVASPSLVRSVRGLAGGTFDWMPDGACIVFVDSTGDLRSWNLGPEDDVIVANSDERSVSSPVVDADGRLVAYAVDQAEIRVFDLSARSVRRVDSGDFAFVVDPVWRNGRLVWQAWSPPHMPWDESALVGEEGILFADTGVQHQQPNGSLEGASFGWLDDSDGWLNVVVGGFGRVAEHFEHGGPTWGERQRSWCFDSTGRRFAFVRNEGGFGRLCSIDLDSGAIVERAKAVHGQLSWRGDRLAAIRTGGRTPTQIVVYDTSGERWDRTTVEVGSAFDWSESSALVEPDLIVVPVSESGDSREVLYARLYRNPDSRGRLVCWIHGGPTDQWQVTFMARLAFWVDRGYDVLVPDFRGSTGHGRAYTQALSGLWGELDVDDVERILSDVSARQAYRSGSVALIGSSAGGLTALGLAARESALAAAVAVSYPVCDIAALDAVTHRFEAHYNRSLMGSPEETIRRSNERSPIGLAKHIARLPVLVFHGTRDPVVPIEQSRRLVAELHAHDGRAELVVFDDEGHGFRKPENKIRELEVTEDFFERHLVSGPGWRQGSGVDDR